MKWTNKGHQFDAIGEHFVGKNIYIYGAGQTGKWVFNRLCFLNAVDAFVDINEEKQHGTLLDKPVLSPDILYKNHDRSHIIVVAIKDEKSAEAVMYRLLCSGYIRNYDFFSYLKFVPQESTENYRDSFYLRIYSVYAHNKIWLDSTAIFPSTLCNLKCKYCLAFTPYIKSHRIKALDECKDEVDSFFKWVDRVRWFQISGGEPQLWNRLPELLEYMGRRYRDRIGQRFEVVTNGSIMPSERLLDVMFKYHMNMCIDDYGDNYGKLGNRAKDIVTALKMKGIDYIYDKPKQWVDLGCANTNRGELKDLETWFDECGLPFHANEYGKIYTCSYGNFAIKAGLMEDAESEYFDLHQEITDIRKKEFVEFCLGYSEKGYSDLCRKCYGWVETVNEHFVPAAVQAEKVEGKSDAFISV